MSRLKWDQTGERKYETGTKQGVLYVQNGSSYNEGVAWNGLTGVTESPSGAEANDMWADNIKYGSLRSAETFGGTIEAYTYPEEFKPCNGENELIPGVSLGQQKRNPFAFSYVSDVGNDTPTDDDNGYKIHIIYNATASPAEKGYTTINDSPEAITFSWEISTTPIDVPGFKPTASLEIDTTNLDKYQKELGLLDDIEDTLYGTDGYPGSLVSDTNPTLMLPNEVAKALEINIIDAEFIYRDEEETIVEYVILPDLSKVSNPILIIPNNVTNIDSSAFYLDSNKLEKLVYIILPNSLTEIEDYSFYGISNKCSLKKIIIPDQISYIGEKAFNLCNKMRELIIPNSVTSIGDNAFAECHKLRELIIPNSVTSIGDFAFTGCYSLISLVIGNGVTYLGRQVFYGCYLLKKLIIPDSVTSIGIHAFSECRSLASLTIPNSVTSIGDCAFNNCFALTSLTIPNSVTSIGNSAFSECRSLASLTIPNSVTSIGNSAFSECRSLASLTIPNSVTSIGDYAFDHCESLKEVILPNSIADIGFAAFIFSGLEKVFIPDSVTNIGDYAFYYSDYLSTIDLTSFDYNNSNFQVPVLGSVVFPYDPDRINFYFKDQATLDAFAAATNWSKYADYFEVAS